ncbi:MAG: hypothetical protein ACLR0U_26185 [Enterocloster clostridioformis]
MMCTRSSLSPASKRGNTQEIREFDATTRELLEMADWLKDGGCEMVAMESAASIETLYNILESSDWNAIVINARHMRGSARPEDGCKGYGMDCRSPYARSAPGKLYPRQRPA